MDRRRATKWGNDVEIGKGKGGVWWKEEEVKWGTVHFQVYYGALVEDNLMVYISQKRFSALPLFSNLLTKLMGGINEVESRKGTHVYGGGSGEQKK